MQPADAVRLENVTKVYGTGHAQTRAVTHMTLVVAQGEFVSVMGPSGCGKSTLLNLIAGYDKPSAGRVIVAGKDVWRLNEHGRSDLRARSLGFVVQNFDLLPRLTAEENVLVRLGPLRMARHHAQRRAAAALDKVGIPADAWKRYPGELSGGEQQRVAMARALVAEPLLLLADEPTGNLDSSSGAKILDLLRDLVSEHRTSVVMVTHDAFASTFGHRTIVMKDGAIVHDVGSLADERKAGVVRFGPPNLVPPSRR